MTTQPPTEGETLSAQLRDAVLWQRDNLEVRIAAADRIDTLMMYYRDWCRLNNLPEGNPASWTCQRCGQMNGGTYDECGRCTGKRFGFEPGADGG